MFSPEIVESDAFLDMPPSSQALYFHLGMYADDDGFVNPKKIMRVAGSSADDIKVLISKRFVLPFESGVVVIKHWLIHNLIRADRYKETLYKNEKAQIGLNENGAYTELREGVTELKKIEVPEWLKIRRLGQRTANVPQTALRLGKVRLGKDNTVAEKTKATTPLQEVVNYFFELKGWANKEKDFYAKNKIIYSRFVRPAKDLLELCEGDVASAKECLVKISTWAKSRDLDWSIETVFKKWYELDLLKPKEKKPYWDGCRIFRKVENGKWWIVRNGEIKELGRSLQPQEIQWK